MFKKNGKNEIESYINNYIETLKNNDKIDTVALLKESLKKDILLGIIIWFAGSTVIGIPIVYGTIGFKGFCMGYTISSLIAVLGNGNGAIMAFLGMFLQNIIIIPCIIAIATSGIKLYKSTIKNRKRENIKLEICRHTIVSLISIIGISISSFIEVYISTNLLFFFVNYI